MPARQLEQIQQRDALEEQRLRELQVARDAYASECQAREAEVAEANERLDALIAGLQAGAHAAVQEYVGIVLGNSVYPELLSVEHDYEFDPEARELTLAVLISPPDRLPAEKAYRYVKAKDEITATALAKKDLKARYANVVHQVALRTLHEIFEADRAGKIQTITLEVGTETDGPCDGPSSDASCSSVWPRSATPSWRSTCTTSCPRPRLSISARRCRRTHSNSWGSTRTPGVRGG